MADKKATIDLHVLTELMTYSRLYRLDLERLQADPSIRKYQGWRAWVQELQREIEKVEQAIGQAERNSGLKIAL